MRINKIFFLFLFVFSAGCVGYSSTGVLGTGVSIALDPRWLNNAAKLKSKAIIF